MELELIAQNIEKAENGIYFSKVSSSISYPEKGNEVCSQIEQDSFWFNHRNDVIIEIVKQYNHQNVFFDVGGGNGFVAKGLQDEGVDVVLVEPGLVGCLNALGRDITKVVCSTFVNAGFKQSSIGSVGLFDVLEHIEDDSGFLKTLHSRVKNGGFVFLTVPAINFLWSKEDEEGGHYRRYTLKQLRTLVINSGFVVEYSTYFFSILPIPIFLSRTIPSWLGLNSKWNDMAKHKKEHRKRKGLISSLMKHVWKWELDQIRSGRRILIGGSCFLVVKKE